VASLSRVRSNSTLAHALDELRAQLKAAGEREIRLTADLAHERERADKAISALASLADRLDQLAADRQPWWRRLVG
jgi:chromosome segregation ATPase